MKIVSALLCAALLSTSAAAAGYRERQSGDLSDDGLNPTKVKLVVGDNIIDADYGNVDRDYFVIRIPAGHQLTSIVLDPRTQVGSNSSFVGVQKGKQVTVDPDNPTAAPLLGWAHYTTSDEGSDILPRICQGAVAQGCTPPLGPGIYAFWVQELDACACHYRFIFRVEAAAE
jgi:hypothetical protein